jgi:dihydropteroate synthase
MHPLITLPHPRATHWTLRTRTLEFSDAPLVMGILNVTPDSFSDGGQHFSHQAAVEHALRMEDAGADLIDIGGESTRPYSQPVTAEEELRRVAPILESLAGRLACPISIDTSKAAVARAAVELGAEIINDVTALSGDPDMLEVAVRSEAGLCAMHMQGTPQTMQDAPTYTDVVDDILGYLAERDAWLLASGIMADRICLDPGIGFGKTHEHNWQLVQHCHRYHQLGRPLLVGHSRKGFIRKQVSQRGQDVAAGSVGVALALALQGVQVLRVHDVAATRSALDTFGKAVGS